MMLERVVLFLKHHWKVPAIALLLLVCFFLYRSKISSLVSTLAKSREDYKDALDKTNAANKASLEKAHALAEKTLQEQEDQQRRLAEELKKLEDEKEQLEGELEQDLDKLAQEIKDRF